MIIKTRVEKLGEPKDYINLPVTNKLTYNSLDTNGIAIGVITDAIEIDDTYELTINIWDQYITQHIVSCNEKPTSLSISVK